MKKRIALTLVLVMAAVLLAGCAQTPKTPAPAPTEAPAFVPALDTAQEASFDIVGNLSNFEALEAVIAEFRAYYPNVTINYVKLDDYNNLLPLRLENDANTACYLDGPKDAAEDLLAHGVDVSAFGPVIQSCMQDGKLTGIPLGIDVRGLVVNKTLLAAEGQAIPTNMSEFLTVCDALTAKGYTPIQQQHEGAVRNIMHNYLWVLITSSEDPAGLIATMSSGEPGCLSAVRPAYDLYDSFCQKGYISREVNDGIKDNYDAAILNFFLGNVPFLPANSDTVSGMAKRESKSEAFTASPFEYSFIYVPLMEDGVCVEQRAWRCLCVNKNAACKDLAAEFVRFAGTVDSLNLLARVKGIPSSSSAPDDPRFLNINDAKGTYVYAWDYQMPAVVWNSVIGRLVEYSRGEIATLDETLATAEQDILASHAEQ